MKTTIYVDGYNLYYGCLKHSADKLIDLKALLFDRIVRMQDPAPSRIPSSKRPINKPDYW